MVWKRPINLQGYIILYWSVLKLKYFPVCGGLWIGNTPLRLSISGAIIGLTLEVLWYKATFSFRTVSSPSLRPKGAGGRSLIRRMKINFSIFSIFHFLKSNFGVDLYIFSSVVNNFSRSESFEVPHFPENDYSSLNMSHPWIISIKLFVRGSLSGSRFRFSQSIMILLFDDWIIIQYEYDPKHLRQNKFDFYESSTGFSIAMIPVHPADDPEIVLTLTQTDFYGAGDQFWLTTTFIQTWTWGSQTQNPKNGAHNAEKYKGKLELRCLTPKIIRLWLFVINLTLNGYCWPRDHSRYSSTQNDYRQIIWNHL